jgi:hypothetical protein
MKLRSIPRITTKWVLVISSLSVLTVMAACVASAQETQEEPLAHPVRHFAWSQDDSHLALSVNGQILWQLNFGKDETKPYFHPLSPIGGPTLTWIAPPDHPWHYGLWFSWKFINGVNFWEEDRGTGRPIGLTVWEPPDISTKPDGTAEIALSLRYVILSHYQKHFVKGDVILTEQRRHTVHPPDDRGDFRIDWTSVFEAQSDEVLLDRTPIPGEPDGEEWGGYGGLSLRFGGMDAPEIRSERAPVPTEGRFAVIFEGDAADFSGEFHKAGFGISILQSPDNPPSPFYGGAEPNIPFNWLSPALLYSGARKMSKGEKWTVRYSIHVHSMRWTSDLLHDALSQAEWGD